MGEEYTKVQRITTQVMEQFGVSAQPEKLPGGSVEVTRVSDIVLKHIRETSLENNHSLELAAWIAEFSSNLHQDGFRIPRGVPTKTEKWITPEGWTAWTFVEGTHASKDDIPQCIAAIEKLNHSLKAIAKNPLLEDSHTPWAKSQRWCLGDKPDYIHPVVKDYVDKLYGLRQPVETSPYQVMHGDLNPENILVSDHLPPAFVDFSPFWGPPELATAIFATWIGPRNRDAGALGYIKHLPNFCQMLIRAGIRMLLVMSDGGNLNDWELCSEKKAAEIIINFAQ